MPFQKEKYAVWKYSPVRSDPKKKPRIKGQAISLSLKLDIIGMLQELDCDKKSIAAYFKVSEYVVYKIKKEFLNNSESFDSLIQEEIDEKNYEEIVGDILYSFEAENKIVRSAK